MIFCQLRRDMNEVDEGMGFLKNFNYEKLFIFIKWPQSLSKNVKSHLHSKSEVSICKGLAFRLVVFQTLKSLINEKLIWIKKRPDSLS